jgi:ribosome-associated translation inhibitor RaiA
MALETAISIRGVSLPFSQERRIYHELEAIGRRLIHHSEPKASVMLIRHADQRQIDVDLRVQLGSLGSHLVSHQAGETIDLAIHLAVEDVERQLERRHASQRGDAAFSVPSRRLPKAPRAESALSQKAA